MIWDNNCQPAIDIKNWAGHSFQDLDNAPQNSARDDLGEILKAAWEVPSCLKSAHILFHTFMGSCLSLLMWLAHPTLLSVLLVRNVSTTQAWAAEYRYGRHPFLSLAMPFPCECLYQVCKGQPTLHLHLVLVLDISPTWKDESDRSHVSHCWSWPLHWRCACEFVHAWLSRIQKASLMGGKVRKQSDDSNDVPFEVPLLMPIA